MLNADYSGAYNTYFYHFTQPPKDKLRDALFTDISIALHILTAVKKELGE